MEKVPEIKTKDVPDYINVTTTSRFNDETGIQLFDDKQEIKPIKNIENPKLQNPEKHLPVASESDKDIENHVNQNIENPKLQNPEKSLAVEPDKLIENNVNETKKSSNSSLFDCQDYISMLRKGFMKQTEDTIDINSQQKAIVAHGRFKVSHSLQ